MSANVYRKASDLPQRIALFPLSGALVFPRSTLPLNIFEPRYLNMVDDALSGERVIGMIQPLAHESTDATPPLHAIGALGRITTFAETDDGRYLITLSGVCRFRLEQELPRSGPYREALVNYEEFESDLRAASGADIDRPNLRKVLTKYASQLGYEIDWNSLDRASTEELINVAAMLAPFEPGEKQALLEAPTLKSRAETLVTLMEMRGHQRGADGQIQ